MNGFKGRTDAYGGWTRRMAAKRKGESEQMMPDGREASECLHL